MNEFDLIDLIINEISDVSKNEAVVIGPGDDGAVAQIPPGQELVVTTDVLRSGTHFPVGSQGDLIGYRCIAVNISDLAAMGAVPKFATVALMIEEANVEWITAFAQGIATCARECDIAIIGGNLTRGPLSVAVTAHGFVPEGQALLRSGATPENHVWVTGTLGATAAFLEAFETSTGLVLGELHATREKSALARYFLPPLRFNFANRLIGLATSAIDISDGLFADLRHIAAASNCGACIDLEAVPAWSGVDKRQACGANDSYELLFTAAARDASKVLAIARETATPVTLIGTITRSKGIVISGEPAGELDIVGYDHF